MGRGLSWALEVRPIAHCWLGFGPGPRAHLWALRKSSARSFPQPLILVSCLGVELASILGDGVVLFIRLFERYEKLRVSPLP
jgi:hypothetical protein